MPGCFLCVVFDNNDVFSFNQNKSYNYWIRRSDFFKQLFKTGYNIDKVKYGKPNCKTYQLLYMWVYVVCHKSLKFFLVYSGSLGMLQIDFKLLMYLLHTGCLSGTFKFPIVRIIRVVYLILFSCTWRIERKNLQTFY